MEMVFFFFFKKGFFFYEAINIRRDISEMGKRHWKLKKEDTVMDPLVIVDCCL